MGSPLLLCLLALVFASGAANAQMPGSLFSVDSASTVNPFEYDGESVQVHLSRPFVYAGRNYSLLYLNMNGFVSFFPPNDEESYPEPDVAKDGIFPLWADIENDENGKISYVQETEGPLITQATDALNELLREYNSTVTWVFFASWCNTPLELESENVTFQVALITDDVERSYVLMNYEDIPSLNQIWMAGFAVDNNKNFMTLPVKTSSDLSSTSNVGVPGRWLFTVQNGPNVIFFPITPEARVSSFPYDGASVLIDLDYAFTYNGRNYSQFYLDMNGFVSFFKPSPEMYPNASIGQDLIAAFWADIENHEGGVVYYEQATDGPLIQVAIDAVNQAFEDADFEEAAWVFVATWLNTPLEYGDSAAVSFQLVLISDEYGRSYVVMNYQNYPDISAEYWLAGFAIDNDDFEGLQVNDSSDLSSESNVGFPGRWVFQVSFVDICDVLQCAEDEVCVERTGVYGCNCAANNPRPNPDTFDAIETCKSSFGMVSFSRCQLFEAGYSAQFLHLNDDKCKGVVHGDRVVFYFDYDGHSCGTDLKHNDTHFMYENKIEAIMGVGDESVISRDSWLRIDVSCVYPLIESNSNAVYLEAKGSVIRKDLATEGSYEIVMIPYPDPSFSTPYPHNVTLHLNDLVYVAVNVVGVDSKQISIVLDRCWATPVYDMDYIVYWNLIINECPNPEDGTVQVLQNGVSTSGRFSFRMFTFTSISPYVILHCQVHLCLVESGECAQTCIGDSDRRKRRSVDFHDTFKVSMSI